MSNKISLFRQRFITLGVKVAGYTAEMLTREFDARINDIIHMARIEGAREERERLASLAESIRSAHDIAECAAYVEGETGRQEVINQWLTICDEPDTWLRELADDPDWLDAVCFAVWEECVDAHQFIRGTTLPENPYSEEVK